jgi:prevent-host-death family protein
VTHLEQVGVRALRIRLSHYLEQVRAGHPIQIIDRGEVIVELLPPARPVASDSREADVADRGVARGRVPNDPSLYPTFPRLTPPGTAKRLLDEERGKR